MNINEEINDMLNWYYYDYYNPIEDDNPNNDHFFIFGLPIFNQDYFKYI